MRLANHFVEAHHEYRTQEHSVMTLLAAAAGLDARVKTHLTSLLGQPRLADASPNHALYAMTIARLPREDQQKLSLPATQTPPSTPELPHEQCASMQKANVSWAETPGGGGGLMILLIIVFSITNRTSTTPHGRVYKH